MKFLAMTIAVLAALSVSIPPATADNQEHRNSREAHDSSISDRELTANVKNALAQDRALKKADLDIDSDDGVVKITGDVNNGQEKEAISRIVRGVDGVRSVSNVVKLRP